jgi:hypothetical protein
LPCDLANPPSACCDACRQDQQRNKPQAVLGRATAQPSA